MKKYISLLIITVCISGLFYNCQRDDLCPELTPTTPQLILRFFDNDNQLEFRQVNSLRIISQSLGTIIVDRQTTDSIAIPLRSLEDVTTFIMITDSEDDSEGMETGNTDILTFNYNTREVFLSRACGFIANYENLIDNLEIDPDNWIDSITILNPIVDNENEAHVQIFH